MKRNYKASSEEEEAVQSKRRSKPRNQKNGNGKVTPQASPKNSDTLPSTVTAHYQRLLHNPGPSKVSILVTLPNSQQTEDEGVEANCQSRYSGTDNDKDDDGSKHLTTPTHTPENPRTIIMMVSRDGSSSCLSFPAASLIHGDVSGCESYESEDDLRSDPSFLGEDGSEAQDLEHEEEELLELEAEKGSPKPRSPNSQPSSLKSRKQALPRGCYFVYLLRSAPTGEWYIGKTYNPLQRLNEHNIWFKKGSNIYPYTKDQARRPWVMVALVRVEEVGSEGDLLVQRQESIWFKQFDGLHQEDQENKTMYTNDEALASFYEMICRPEFENRPYEIRFMDKHVALAFDKIVREKGSMRRGPCRIVKDFPKRGEVSDSRNCQTRLLSKVPTDCFRYANYIPKAHGIIERIKSGDDGVFSCTVCEMAIIPEATARGDYLVCPSGRCEALSHIQCLRESFSDDEIAQRKSVLGEDFYDYGEKITFPTAAAGCCKTCRTWNLWQDYVTEAKIRNEWTPTQLKEILRVCLIHQRNDNKRSAYMSWPRPSADFEAELYRSRQLKGLTDQQRKVMEEVVKAVMKQHNKYANDPSKLSWLQKISLRHIICEGWFVKWVDEHIDNVEFKNNFPRGHWLSINTLHLLFHHSGISTAKRITSRKSGELDDAAKEYFREDDMAWVWLEDFRIRAEIEKARKDDEEANLKAAERRREQEALEEEEKKARELAEANQNRFDAERTKAEQRRISRRQEAQRKLEQEQREKDTADREAKERKEEEVKQVGAAERQAKERQEDEAKRAEAERRAAAQFKEDQARWEKKWGRNLRRAEAEPQSVKLRAVTAETPGQASRKRRMSVETPRINNGDSAPIRSVRARPLTGAGNVTTPLRRSPRGRDGAIRTSSIKLGCGYNTVRTTALPVKGVGASYPSLPRSIRLEQHQKPDKHLPNLALACTPLLTSRSAQPPANRNVQTPGNHASQTPAPRIQTGVPLAIRQYTYSDPSTPANPAFQTPRRTSPRLSQLSAEKHMLKTMLWALECYAKLTAHNNRQLEGAPPRECDKYVAANWSRAKPKWAAVCRTKEGREFKARMRGLLEKCDKPFFRGDGKISDGEKDGYVMQEVEKVGVVYHYLNARTKKLEVELNVSRMNPRY